MRRFKDWLKNRDSEYFQEVLNTVESPTTSIQWKPQPPTSPLAEEEYFASVRVGSMSYIVEFLPVTTRGVFVDKRSPSGYYVSFKPDNPDANPDEDPWVRTNAGNASEVLGVVMSIIKEFLAAHPVMICWTPADPVLGRLYSILERRFLKGPYTEVVYKAPVGEKFYVRSDLVPNLAPKVKLKEKVHRGNVGNVSLHTA